MASGYDFEITNEKVFNVYSIKGVDRSNEIVLEYGKNVDSMHVIEDFTHPSNRAIVLGEVIGETTIQRVDTDDIVSQETYKLREYVDTESEPSEPGTFSDVGEAINRKYGSALFRVDVKLVRGSDPSINDFDLGDVVKIIAKKGIYNINEEYRVFEWEIQYASDNTETLTILLGKFTL